MPKLTDTQLVVLSAAAARKNNAVLPLPETLKAKGGAATASLKSLLKKGLVEETQAKAKELSWREDDDQRFGLVVTKAGLDAIGVVADTADGKPDPGSAGPKPVASMKGANSITKADVVVGLLERPEGAGIADTQAATGWQPHSIRAFLSGLRKKGIDIGRTKDEAGKAVYGITVA